MEIRLSNTTPLTQKLLAIILVPIGFLLLFTMKIPDAQAEDVIIDGGANGGPCGGGCQGLTGQPGCDTSCASCSCAACGPGSSC